MTEHVSHAPFALDPLIAEAKRRMRRRRLGLGAVLIAATCLALGPTLLAGGPTAPPSGTPTVYRVGWSRPITVGGRRAIEATIYWVRIYRSRWAVKASVVNLTRHTVRPARKPFETGWGMNAVTAGQLAHPVQCSGYTCFASRAVSFSPALPRTLPAGARWTGVVGGTAGEWRTMPHNRWASFSLGYYWGWRGGFGIGTPFGRAFLHIR